MPFWNRKAAHTPRVSELNAAAKKVEEDKSTPEPPPSTYVAQERAEVRAEIFEGAEDVELIAPNLENMENTAGGVWSIDPSMDPVRFAETYAIMMRAQAQGPNQTAKAFDKAKGKIDVGGVKGFKNTAGGNFSFGGAKTSRYYTVEGTNTRRHVVKFLRGTRDAVWDYTGCCWKTGMVSRWVENKGQEDKESQGGWKTGHRKRKR
ncbi:hypothetical protein BDQ12DRAFT_670710 [Crucibulum laeve]|uniref:Uncharacterized protein n=1 Tax=Crucibulum laeve TaxID=68775 RepID=A0A5C3LJW9_9AGAR|nr:hypothetical protein BDQ12DRAFT_670710 [Crucibulum laeve]